MEILPDPFFNHLETARLCRAGGKGQEAEGHRLKAKELIDETGYLRRKKELLTG